MPALQCAKNWESQGFRLGVIFKSLKKIIYKSSRGMIWTKSVFRFFKFFFVSSDFEQKISGWHCRSSFSVFSGELRANLIFFENFRIYSKNSEFERKKLSNFFRKGYFLDFEWNISAWHCQNCFLRVQVFVSSGSFFSGNFPISFWTLSQNNSTAVVKTAFYVARGKFWSKGIFMIFFSKIFFPHFERKKWLMLPNLLSRLPGEKTFK